MYRAKSDESLLKELLERGYGTDRREEWRKKRRKNLRARLELEKRRADGPQSPDTYETLRSTPLGRKTESGTQRRAEDAVARLPAKLRRRIDAFAHKRKYKITGLEERFRSFLTHFNRGIKDRAARELIRILVDGRGYLRDLPGVYCLRDNLDALYFCGRNLLGEGRSARLLDLKKKGGGSAIGERIRMRSPVAYTLLTRLQQRDDLLERALDYLSFRYKRGDRIEVMSLARIVKSFFHLFFTVGSIRNIDELLRVVVEINRGYSPDPRKIREVDATFDRFAVAYANLNRFKHELFPALLKMTGAFFAEEDMEARENILRIYRFLEIGEQDRLSVSRSTAFVEVESKAEENEVEESEGGEAEEEGEREEAAFGREQGWILTVLKYVFPGSGIEKLDTWPHILPYFDLKVFNKSLTFPESTRSIAHNDPMGQIMVLHRVLDDLLTSFSGYDADRILEMEGLFDQRLSDITSEWERIYPNLFDPYLKELTDYVRLAAQGGTGAGSPARKIEENLNQIRNLAVRNFGGAIVLPESRQLFSTTRLYKLAEELDDLFGEVREKCNRKLVAAGDAVADRILSGFSDHRVIDFESNSYKTVMRRMKRYIEARGGPLRPANRRKTQLLALEILDGLIGLYRFLLTDGKSPYRTAEGRAVFAGEKERSEWESVADSLEVLRVTDDREDEAIRDPVTGLAAGGYWRDNLTVSWEESKSGEEPLVLIHMVFDHWDWLSQTFAQVSKRNELLHCAARSAVEKLEELDTESPEAALGYGIDAARTGSHELSISLHGDLRTAAILGENIREVHAERFERLPLYRDVPEDKRGSHGTLSVGVTQIDDYESTEAALERVKEAAKTAAGTGNCTVVFSEGQMTPFQDYIQDL
jgi:GGDEF domain-containing protein